jgi:hypothetical protein
MYLEVSDSAICHDVLPCAQAFASVVLVTYLQHYSNDGEAWEELADMYLEVSCYYRVQPRYNILHNVWYPTSVA